MNFGLSDGVIAINCALLIFLILIVSLYFCIFLGLRVLMLPGLLDHNECAIVANVCLPERWQIFISYWKLQSVMMHGLFKMASYHVVWYLILRFLCKIRVLATHGMSKCA